MQIDQAIFTSARTSRGDGYQLVARSEGVSDAEAKDLTTWGPSHDSLFEPGPSAVSYNCWRLSSGRMCISRTVPGGAEFSQRGGLRVYTQFLLAPDDVLERFACNPFAVLKAALADGHLRVLDQAPPILPPLVLTGRASVVDRAAVDRVRNRLGPGGLAAVMQVILGEAPVALVGGMSPYLVYSAVINCLPPECRGEFPFTTGLKHSVRRSLRLFVGPTDEAERRQVFRACRCVLLDTGGAALEKVQIEHGWAAFLRAALSGERPLDLTMLFSHVRPSLTTAGLDQLGHELAADLANGKLSRAVPLRASGYLRITDSTPDANHASVTLSPEAMQAWRALRDTKHESRSGRETAVPGKKSPEHVPDPPKPEKSPQTPSRFAATIADESGDSTEDGPRSSPAADQIAHSHAAHQRFEQSRSAVVTAVPSSATALAESSVDALDPVIVERLELLDDLVFEAIKGSAAALARFKTVWPETISTLSPLGAEAIEESREQYVQRAKAVWEEHNGGATRRPELAAAALEILTLLLDERSA